MLDWPGNIGKIAPHSIDSFDEVSLPRGCSVSL